jgi:hypothetical protein
VPDTTFAIGYASDDNRMLKSNRLNQNADMQVSTAVETQARSEKSRKPKRDLKEIIELYAKI